MNSLRKILVVDNGDRQMVDPLSAELAELGVSSVTTSFEAADDVLAVIDRPSAIFVRMPPKRYGTAYQDFVRFADRLRSTQSSSGVPVIMWDGMASIEAGGISAMLRDEFGPNVLSSPEL